MLPLPDFFTPHFENKEDGEMRVPDALFFGVMKKCGTLESVGCLIFCFLFTTDLLPFFVVLSSV